MTPLIDATEMYLRSIWELEEEGITPIRARLVERLGLSAPSVSETVMRLEEEGLVTMRPDRTLGLTEEGRAIAVSVMRKHRLAEVLLTDVIGLEWEQVHAEACRWEHVISDRVERHLAELLGNPEQCPHGNPIPTAEGTPQPHHLMTATEAAKEGHSATVVRISEMLQGDIALMRAFHDQGLRPGAEVALSTETGTVIATIDGQRLVLAGETSDFVYVAPAEAGAGR